MLLPKAVRERNESTPEAKKAREDAYQEKVREREAKISKMLAGPEHYTEPTYVELD